MSVVSSHSLMEIAKAHIDRDVVLTAIVVIPASTLWITTENLAASVILGSAIYAAAEFGIPYLRDNKKIDLLELSLRCYEQARAAILARVKRTA